MHELSIARSIVELAVEEAVKSGTSAIRSVELEIGTMAGVETDALLFAWDSATIGTPAAQSELKILIVKAEGQCQDCGLAFPVNSYYELCPGCGGYHYRVNGGKELRIRTMIVE
jgi:hydrogenase nickel incorporation protein HypA/HybF